MSRPYSAKFLIQLSNSDSDKVGIQLARLCVDANLPAKGIADHFGVSRMAVHGWFRGKYIREKTCIRIQKFLNVVRADLELGTLPAKSIPLAKKWLKDIEDDN
jgi:hypothetical protein